MTKEVLYLKCPSCGESNYKQLNETTCECNIYGCKTKFFIVDSDISSELNEALHARERYNFKQADEIYINILSKTQDEKVKVSCYFGRLLTYFGVIYVKDLNGNSVITFSNYDKEYESIKESTYYNQIINSSYSYLYIDKLEELDKEYKKIKKELEKEILYDVFICVKISNKTILNPILEGYTVDSNYARDIYDELTKKGLKVFYSEKVLSGIEYDAQIYSALMRSKSILVITTKKEYLESSWVQSEWRRWINFIKEDVKERNSLYLFIPNDVQHIELPKILNNPHVFKDTLKLVSMIENKIKPNNESNGNLEEILIKANNFILFNRYNEAEMLYQELCQKYLYDFRPWLGLLEILIKTNKYKNDNKFTYFFDKALSLCTSENTKQEIRKKYSKYITSNIQFNDDNNDDNNDEALLDKLISNYKNNQYNLAFNGFYNLANKGNFEAQYYLGLMYYHEKGVARNYREAFKWYEKAANQGHPYAQCNLGVMYEKGNYVEQNYEEAFKWYEKAANQGHAGSQYNLALMYEYGTGVSQSIIHAKYWCKKALDQGFNLASNLWERLNKINERDYEIEGDGNIIKPFHHPQLMTAINALVVDKNYSFAFDLFTILANEGDSSAQYMLGEMYLEGKGVNRDYNQAKKWYSLAAKNGHTTAKEKLNEFNS